MRQLLPHAYTILSLFFFILSLFKKLAGGGKKRGNFLPLALAIQSVFISSNDIDEIILPHHRMDKVILSATSSVQDGYSSSSESDFIFFRSPCITFCRQDKGSFLHMPLVLLWFCVCNCQHCFQHNFELPVKECFSFYVAEKRKKNIQDSNKQIALHTPTCSTVTVSLL